MHDRHGTQIYISKHLTSDQHNETLHLLKQFVHIFFTNTIQIKQIILEYYVYSHAPFMVPSHTTNYYGRNQPLCRTIQLAKIFCIFLFFMYILYFNNIFFIVIIYILYHYNWASSVTKFKK